LQQRKILTAIRIFCKNIASTFRRVYTFALFCKFICRRILLKFFAQNPASPFTLTGISQYCSSIASLLWAHFVCSI